VDTLVGQVTVSVKPTYTPTFSDPQTVYESVSTAEPTVGKNFQVGNPTWKLSKPFTAAAQTNCR